MNKRFIFALLLCFSLSIALNVWQSVQFQRSIQGAQVAQRELIEADGRLKAAASQLETASVRLQTENRRLREVDERLKRACGIGEL